MMDIRLELSDEQWLDLDGRLRGFIKSRIHHSDDVDDILQDSYQSMQLRIEQLAEGERFEAWLYTIVRHKIIDFYRKHKIPSIEIEDYVQFEAKDESVLSELTPCVAVLLQGLNAEDREILKSIHLNQTSLQEFSQQKQLSMSAVKSRVQRARIRLRAVFEKCCQFKYKASGELISIQQGICHDCGTNKACAE